MSRTGAKVFALVLLFVTVGDIVGCVVWNVWNYNTNIYSFQKKMANLDRATTTSDLKEAGDYCMEVYDYIKKYKGNPNWWPWKTKRTDWDDIKSDFKSVIDDAYEAHNRSSPGDDAYQEALKVFREKIDGVDEDDKGLYDQIDENFDLELYKEQWPILWFFWLSIIILIIVTLIALVIAFDSYY